MSTKLKKRHTGAALLAGLTLSIAILAGLLPGWAEAQEVDTDAVSIETAQNANNADQANGADNAADEVTTAAMSTASTTSSQSAYEERAAAALVVEPGDSLWAIAQERLGPEATPQQVAQETGRIYELNRERIGDNPNLIFPGQELLLAQGPEPAADVAPTTAGVVATEPAEVPAAGEPAEVPDAATQDDESAAQTDEEPSYPLPYGGQRAPGMWAVLISLGFFLGALAVAALAVVKLHRRRRLLGGLYGSSYEPSQPEREADKRKRPAPEVPGPTAEVRETQRRNS